MVIQIVIILDIMEWIINCSVVYLDTPLIMHKEDALIFIQTKSPFISSLVSLHILWMRVGLRIILLFSNCNYTNS